MEDISFEEKKNALIEAGIHEENMSIHEINSYYRVIRDSKSTATQENNTRELNQSILEIASGHDSDTSPENSQNLKGNEVVVSAVIEHIPKKIAQDLIADSEQDLVVADNNNTENNTNPDSDQELIVADSIDADSDQDLLNDEDRALDATKAFVPFEDMPKFNEAPVKIIVRPMKYLNIQNSNEFQRATVKKKARMFYSYFTDMAEQRSKLYRTSYSFAPLPHPIPLKVCSDDEDFNRQSFSQQETYVSKSGRQTKRRLYNVEHEGDSSDEFSSKKRKNKWSFNKDDDSSEEFIIEKYEVDVRKQKKKEATWLSKNMEKHTLKFKGDLENPETTPKPGRSGVRGPKKLSNDEIMCKSSLFDDSPKRIKKSSPSLLFGNSPVAASKKTKKNCELLFDQLVEDINEDEGKENTAAIKQTEKDIPDNSDSQKIMPYEEYVLSKLDTDRQVRRQLPVTIESPSTSQGKKEKRNLNTEHKTKKTFGNTSVTNGFDPSETIKLVKRCPICDRLFPEDEIQEHAWTCGEDVDMRNIPSDNTHTQSSLMCQFCDKMFIANYEEHVSQCMKRKHKKEEIDKFVLQ